MGFGGTGLLGVRWIGLLALAFAVAACGGDDGTGPDDDAPSSRTVQATAGNTFNPSQVSIRRGGTVTWEFLSQEGHNVTFANVAGRPANIDTRTSGTESRTFSTAGTFSYGCTIHPGMNGSVSVSSTEGSDREGY